MPKKHTSNKDMTQKVDKNRPKTKAEKKEEKKNHKQLVASFFFYKAKISMITNFIIIIEK